MGGQQWSGFEICEVELLGILEGQRMGLADVTELIDPTLDLTSKDLPKCHDTVFHGTQMQTFFWN